MPDPSILIDMDKTVVYSQIELAKKSSEIKHKVVRKLIEKYKIKQGIELHYDGDLPAQSGMGSSSSFVVGCNNILSNLCGKSFTKKKLANENSILSNRTC